jgi:hypothetical protein
VLALAATSGALLVAVAWLAGSEGSVRKALAVVERSLVRHGCTHESAPHELHNKS